MEILIIGYSNLFKNRIISVINELAFIEKVSIAKFAQQEWDDKYKSISKPVELYDDYESAISEFRGNLTYITTTNHSHFEWAKRTLEKGIHTIVDKPATIKHSETEELLEIARNNNLLLSESTVYLYHPQIKVLTDYIRNYNLLPKQITCLFSFPPLNKDNFRYNKTLGGGAMLDTGPYVASIARFFFNEIPEECYTVVNEVSETGVEISYSVLMKFSGGRSIIAHSGFTTEYVNRINILGKDICLDIDRIFTLPDTVENIVKVRSKNIVTDLTVPAGNMFKEYFMYIERCIRDNTYSQLYDNMLTDSKIRSLLIKK